MSFTFKRVPESPFTPGTYAQWPANKSGLLAECCCPNGHGGTLRSADFAGRPGNHRVAADGTVTPSYVCPGDGCSFHEWVKLEDWVAA